MLFYITNKMSKCSAKVFYWKRFVGNCFLASICMCQVSIEKENECQFWQSIFNNRFYSYIKRRRERKREERREYLCIVSYFLHILIRAYNAITYNLMKWKSVTFVYYCFLSLFFYFIFSFRANIDISVKKWLDFPF